PTTRGVLRAPIAVAQTAAPLPRPAHDRTLLTRYCIGCHNEKLKTAGLALDPLDLDFFGGARAGWGKGVWEGRGGIMPPAGRPRPAAEAIDEFASWLEGELDRAAVAAPEPGRVPHHRLNRAEYTNAVRDLLDLDIDGQALLPPDDSGHGFDNMAGTLA